MSEKDKQRLKNIKEIIMRLKNTFHRCKTYRYGNKVVFQRYFLLVLLSIFKR